MESICRHPSLTIRFHARWLVLVAVLLVRPSWAQLPIYVTPGVVYNNSGFQISATNFLNPSGDIFNISFTNYVGLNGWASSLYHGWYYTQNFTNAGEMDCNSGYNFNLQSPTSNAKQYAANTFYNVSGANINCAANFTNSFYYGGILVWATNIISSGNITIGEFGKGSFNGNNLDFTGGSLVINNPYVVNSGSSVGFFGQAAGSGINTNAWSPGLNLSPTNAYSSGPFQYSLSLNGSLAYLHFFTNNATTNIVIRAVFLNNLSSNTVPANVYFGNLGVGDGAANVEWVASNVNPVDGSVVTNYLYLNNNYTQGAQTNVPTINGIPDNFTFFSSPVSLSAGLIQVTNTGFPSGFTYPLTSISNFYSYANVQLTSSTVSTNETNPQDFRQLTNLLGQVVMNASNSLTFSGSLIEGMNYTRLNCTNQFNDDGSSPIVTVYSDSYLGVTNGSMTISNLYSSQIPGWSGSVQVWSTDWTNPVVDANGFTTEYKVLLVQSSVNAFNPSYQQDFVLYSSNNVVLSDSLNIYRTLSINCTNLLLTTNTPGNGASSFDGDLNLNNPSMVWANCLPRLSILTNNGAIRSSQIFQFGGGAAQPYLEFVNTGIISNATTVAIVANDAQSSGSITAGNFSVQAQTVSLTNGIIMASGAFSSTSSSLIIGGNYISNGLSMILTATNLLTDTGVTNGNVWVLGAGNTGSSAAGLQLTMLPAVGDLLGTTVTNIAANNANGTKVIDIWAGHDYGASPAGFSNNAALGQLVLDALGSGPKVCCFQFNGVATGGVTNALYVDCLQLADYTTNLDASYNVTNLFFNTNIVIYYAQALKNGVSVAEKLNGKNGNHLRWVPTYAGYFSSTNLVYPPGVTNVENAALAASPDIDSDGDGNPNAFDSTPFFVSAQVNLNIVLTNLPPKSFKILWPTIPLATNNIYYRTNLISGAWLPFTNFNNYYYGANLAVTNALRKNSFISPQPYVPNASLPDNSQVTNVWVFDALTNGPRYYRVLVQPNPY